MFNIYTDTFKRKVIIKFHLLKYLIYENIMLIQKLLYIIIVILHYYTVHIMILICTFTNCNLLH